MFIFDMLRCIQVDTVSSTWLIDNYWTRGQSETMVLIEWFESGDQNGSQVRNELVN